MLRSRALSGESAARGRTRTRGSGAQERGTIEPMSTQTPEFARPENNRFPGYRLGYPESGPGSIAGLGRRIGGVLADWFLALGLGNLFFGGDPVLIAALFIGVGWLSIWLLGSTLGHRIFGMQLSRLDGSPPGWWRPLLRQTLLMLVLPPLVWDTDHRGGHDIISGLALRLR